MPVKKKKKSPTQKKSRYQSRLLLFYVLLIIFLVPLLVWVAIKFQRGEESVLPAHTTQQAQP